MHITKESEYFSRAKKNRCEFIFIHLYTYKYHDENEEDSLFWLLIIIPVCGWIYLQSIFSPPKLKQKCMLS